MFCMGCGAELPPRAAVCAVCGHAAGSGGEARAAHTPPDVLELADATGQQSAVRSRSAPAALSPAHSPALSPAPAGARGPSISSGDLDQTGFPRDALGRALIFTVLAMAADLLAPWVNLGGNRVAPSSLGLLPVLAVVWLALAALPLLRPSLRATPIYAVAPLVVGTTSLGLGVAVWVRVTLLGTQTLVAGAGSYAFVPLGASNSADVGLYLFLAGAVVLIVSGYQMFLAAAQAQARAELRAEVVPSLRGQASPPPAAQHAASNGQSTLDSAAAGAGSVSRPLPVPPPPATPSAPSVPNVPQAAPDGRRGVALPGSAAWSQTPQTPDFQRPSPSLGWRHRGP